MILGLYNIARYSDHVTIVCLSVVLGAFTTSTLSLARQFPIEISLTGESRLTMVVFRISRSDALRRKSRIPWCFPRAESRSWAAAPRRSLAASVSPVLRLPRRVGGFPSESCDSCIQPSLGKLTMLLVAQLKNGPIRGAWCSSHFRQKCSPS